MITRIVRMSFKPEKVDEFLAVFHNSMIRIKSFKGCDHLNLHQDFDQTNVYYTVSHWESADHLESYRESNLFKETWGKVKPLFNDKPRAYSLDEKIV